MPYIDRDELGRITGIYERPQREGQEYVEQATLWIDPKEAAIAEKQQRLAALGLSQDWQVFSAMAGMVALGAAQGKTEVQTYAGNPGYRKAKDLAVWMEAHNLEHGL